MESDITSGDSPLTLDVTTQKIHVSATLAIHELVAKRRSQGHQIIQMGFGQASLPLHPDLKNALADSSAYTYYAPVLGIPDLREAIADYLNRTRGFSITADQVAVGPGSKTLLYALLQIFSGDLLLPAPSWVSYAPMAQLLGRKIIPVQTDPADFHRLTPEALSEALTKGKKAGLNPKVLLVNSPNNPTGSMFAEEDVKAIVKWTRKEGITLLSDEIYAELAHGWRKHVSPFPMYQEGCVMTGGLSKTFSAGGWRLGYAVFPNSPQGKKAMTSLHTVGSELWSSTTTPVQKAAIHAFKPNQSIEEYVRRSAKFHGYVADKIHNTFLELGIPCPRPAGGFYLYPDLSPWRIQLQERGVKTSDDLSSYLLEAWNLATLPASEFNEGTHPLRLRLATSMLYEPDEKMSKEQRDAKLMRMLQKADAKDFHLDLPEVTRAQEKWKAIIYSLRKQGAVESFVPQKVKTETIESPELPRFSVKRNLRWLRNRLNLISIKNSWSQESSQE